MRRFRARAGWSVHGLARRPPDDIAGLRPVSGDLTDPASLARLADLHPTHVSITMWSRQAAEAEDSRRRPPVCATR